MEEMNETNQRINWNEYFLEIARTVSKRSSCLRAHVGAVIVGKDKKIKAKGECYRIANNIQSGTMYETCRSIHAEQNAIIQAGQDRCMGSSMYIWGHNFICILCKRFIVQSGIETIYLKKDENTPIVVVTADELKKELSDTTVAVVN
jgi:dCMP deaminase